MWDLRKDIGWNVVYFTAIFGAISCIIFFIAEAETHSNAKEDATFCIRYLEIFSPLGNVIFLDKDVPTDAKKLLKWSVICLLSLIVLVVYYKWGRKSFFVVCLFKIYFILDYKRWMFDSFCQIGHDNIVTSPVCLFVRYLCIDQIHM